MAAVHVVKVAFDQVIEVIAVGYGRMSAGGAVDVVGGVAGAAMVGRAPGGVGCVDGDRAFIDVIAVDLVQVPVVKVIDVAGVLHREMAAVRAVNMIVGWVDRVRHETSYWAVARQFVGWWRDVRRHSRGNVIRGRDAPGFDADDVQDPVPRMRCAGAGVAASRVASAHQRSCAG